jgi:hypothetical protein
MKSAKHEQKCTKKKILHGARMKKYMVTHEWTVTGQYHETDNKTLHKIEKENITS